MNSRFEFTPRGKNRVFKSILMTATAFGLLGMTSHAMAQEEPAKEVVVTGKRVSAASIAIGTNEPTATVSITRDALLSAPAGITGLKMLESLPGFNVQANDALGMYEFGNSVTVRAFNFQQIGFLLDNIPMGRSDQFGGSPIYRYVDNENLERVTASSGAGDPALPSYASLGPIVDYFTTKPSKDFGGLLSYTRGTDDLSRGFFKLESGEYNGFSGYISASVIKGELWRGPGTFDRQHYEGKARWAFEGGDLTFQTVHNDYFDYDSPDISLAQYKGTTPDLFGRSGRTFGYLDFIPSPGAFGTPQTATNLPRASATAPLYSNANYASYYKFAINIRKDHLYGLTLNKALTDDLFLTSTWYYEDKGGYGVSPEAWGTSNTRYLSEVATVPGLTAPKGIQYGLSRPGGKRNGLTTKLSWKVGFNTFEGGLWYEQDDYHRRQGRYNVVDGHPDGAPLLFEPVWLRRDYVSTRKTKQYFLKDTLSLLDDTLKVEVGFKALDIDYNITGKRETFDYIAGRTASVDAKWKDDFLPQIGAVYNLTPRDQFFSSYSENMALPRGADDVFTTFSSASAATIGVPSPKAETSTNYEIGYRANHPTFNVSIVAYATKFKNRLQSFASPLPGGAPGQSETFFQNVGGVKAHGMEFSGQWKPKFLADKVYFKSNLSYNVAEFQNNLPANVLTTPIAGKSVPDFPEWVYQGGVTYEAASWAIMNLSARYISERFVNFTNATEIAKGYTVWNAYLDLGDTYSVGPLKKIKLRINVDNMFDKDYLGTINTVVSGTASYRPGPWRTYQVTLSSAF